MFWNPLQATYKKNTAQCLIMCWCFSKRVKMWICFSLPSFFSSWFWLFLSVCRSHMKIIFHTWQLTHNMGLFALNSAPQAAHSLCKLNLCGTNTTLLYKSSFICSVYTLLFNFTINFTFKYFLNILIVPVLYLRLTVFFINTEMFPTRQIYRTHTQTHTSTLRLRQPPFKAVIHNDWTVTSELKLCRWQC